MKKFTVIIASALLFMGCKKIGKAFDGYFYTDVETSAGQLFLYIDDENKGELPNLKTRLSPDNDTVINNALHLTLKSGGRYKVVGKDAQGNVKCSGTLTFKTNSSRGSSTVGGQATTQIDRTFAHKLYY